MKTTKKKSFKRLFAFLMAFVMVTALAANAVFAAGSFTDVKEGDDFYENIESLYAQDIIGGFPDGTFRPKDNLTRQQAAKMVALGANYADHDGTGSKLVDVADLTWGQKNIWALEADGVVKGFGDTNEFRPRLNITRGHVAKMIAKAFHLEEGKEAYKLTDIAGVDNEEYIKILASNGIVSGFKGTTEFRPDELVTRGQFAKMIDLAMKVAPFKVVRVEAINGVTIEVEFSKPVDEEWLEDNWSEPLLGVYGVWTGGYMLSDDGKVLTVDAWMWDTEEALNLDNAPVLVQPFMSAADDEVFSELYLGTLTYKDTVRPTASVERVNFKSFELLFSEPVTGMRSNVSAVYADGEELPTTDGLTIRWKPIHDDLGRRIGLVITLGGNIEADKDIILTIDGTTDWAGNLVNPQPTKLTISKTAQDKVAPKIASITQTGAKTFEIEFDKDVLGTPSVKIGSNSGTVTPVKDSETKFKVSMTSNLEGLCTVTAEDISNLDGYVGTDAKTVTFTLDDAALVVTPTVVAVDGVWHIQLTFDRDINDGAVKVEGNQVKDHITTTVSVNSITTDFAEDADGKDIKNILLVPLEGDLNVEGAVYTLTITSSAIVADDNGAEMEDIEDFVFTRGKDDPTPDVVTDKYDAADITISVPDNDTVKVSFDTTTKLLDNATAVNKANYSITDAIIESATIDSSEHSTVVLKLQKGSIATGYKRTVSVENVKVKDSTKVMDKYSEVIYFSENIRPTIVTAKLTATDKITLTFSEKVTGTADIDKFSLLVGGKVVAGNPEVTVVTLDGTTTAVITLGSNVTQANLESGLSLKILAGNGVLDLNNNALEAVTVDVTQ